MKRQEITLLFVFISLLFAGCKTNREYSSEELADTLYKSLVKNVLDVWYPRSIDSIYGGFFSDFDNTWQLRGNQNKMIVTQARHLWTLSKAAEDIEDELYGKLATYAYNSLKTIMWDSAYGGFYMLRDSIGQTPNSPYADEKTAYGNSFAIYSLAAYYSHSEDIESLQLAKETFYWLEEHSHDSSWGGYYNAMNRDGSWRLTDTTRKDSNSARMRVFKPWKDYNSSIHLMEAFTELYRVWPDSLLEVRLKEMFHLVQETFTHPKGYLQLYFTADWQHVSYRDSSKTVRSKNKFFDHVTFGHDVETAFLLLETSHILYHSIDDDLLQLAKRMVDHAMENGWDSKKGGLLNEGYYPSEKSAIEILNREKVWWVQAENMNALLLMSKFFPQEEKYYSTFVDQWNYIDKYLIDHENGGWYPEGTDSWHRKESQRKGSIWKGNYHNYRAMINCTKMLRNEYELTDF